MAHWVGKSLSTAGATADIPFLLPLGSGSLLQLTLQGAQVRATATTSGGALETLDGILAGSVSKGELLAAIAKVPPDLLPADPALVASLIEGLIAADVDANGDGVKESASVALIFKGKRATLTLP